jgi:hypothetical protein
MMKLWRLEWRIECPSDISITTCRTLQSRSYTVFHEDPQRSSQPISVKVPVANDMSLSRVKNILFNIMSSGLAQ